MDTTTPLQIVISNNHVSYLIRYCRPMNFRNFFLIPSQFNLPFDLTEWAIYNIEQQKSMRSIEIWSLFRLSFLLIVCFHMALWIIYSSFIKYLLNIYTYQVVEKQWKHNRQVACLHWTYSCSGKIIFIY